MGRGSSKAGGGNPLAKFDDNYSKASTPTDIKAGMTLVAKNVNTDTGKSERVKWTFDKGDGVTFTDFVWGSDIIVTSVKVSNKTTKITGRTTGTGTTVRRTFKNTEVLKIRKN